MTANKQNKELSSVLKLGLVLSGIGMFTVFTMGMVSIKINLEVKQHEYFIQENENIELNFEQSLINYTENVQEAFLEIENSLPKDEVDIIHFISDLENLGEEQGLQIKLESQVIEEGSPTLPYRVQFYGGENQLIAFIQSLEAMPYYIALQKIDFRSLELSLEDISEDPLPNISINFALYVEQ
jgi:Tfp pilus assembly protein PilO